MGGEKLTFGLYIKSSYGSPPRWRGKAVKFRCTCGLQRITPAWAGKSKLALCTPSCPTDHPRAGREKNKELEGVWLPMGSPPRRRGKERSTALVGTPTRITPAWAGKSCLVPTVRSGGWDHPRVGGEKGWRLERWHNRRGSPPRGRGKASCFHVLSRSSGITPAWAGKSCVPSSSVRSPSDHPRVGGEKTRSTRSSATPSGSPPRGRGKAEHGELAGRLIGITPAWAGKSRCGSLAGLGGQDHPRVGGEKPIGHVVSSKGEGSPPRGRGKVNE